MNSETKLSLKQLAFVSAYLTSFNATQAAIKAGYSEKTANEQGSRLLANVSIRAQISRQIAEKAMGRDEVLIRMADIARGDIAQLMEVSTVGFTLDMAKAQERGLTKLIKRIRQKTTTYLAKSESGEDREETVLEIELYSAYEALLQLGKEQGLFTTKVKVEDWRDKIIEGLRKGELKPELVEAELGRNLATELFIAAGVPLGQDREVVATDGGSTGASSSPSDAD